MSEQDPFQGWGAKRQEQVDQGLGAIERREIRTDIPCEEARREWFVMAREMYVANNPEPRFTIDLEVGVHIGGCDTTECQQLGLAYFQILKLSHPDASELLSDVIDNLEASIIPSQE